jgi:hypothetical protein
VKSGNALEKYAIGLTNQPSLGGRPLAPPASMGTAVNLHQMALVFISVGIFSATLGILARWFYHH